MDYISAITFEGNLEIPDVSLESPEDLHRIVYSSATTESIGYKLSTALSLRANMKSFPVSGNDFITAEAIKRRVMDAIWAYSLFMIRNQFGDDFLKVYGQRPDAEDLIIKCADVIDEHLEQAHREGTEHRIDMNNMANVLLSLIEAAVNETE